MDSLVASRRSVKAPADEDPLADALRLPAEKDTPEERTKRLKDEVHARERSVQIDLQLAEWGKVLERRKNGLRLLLLGQAESGKTTLLKNFQMHFAPSQFQKERMAWKYVIHLNIIRSVRTILSELAFERSQPSRPASPAYPTPPSSPFAVDSSDLRRIEFSLKPLAVIESKLHELLQPASRNDESDEEVAVRASDRWKRVLSRSRLSSPSATEGSRRSTDTGATLDGEDPWNKVNMSPDDSSRILEASKDDIISLWENETVQEVLRKHKIGLELRSGFFLDDLSRILTATYVPSDTDIVRARLRTLGCHERRYVLEVGPSAGQDMYIVDVGGSRTMRHRWQAFFDDCHAILFLAPLDYDQYLPSEPGYPKINKLEDSMDLWKTICQSPILANTILVLFFNKRDILQQRVASGAQVKDTVTSFGDRPNTVEEITNYFRERFKHYHKKLSPKRRSFMFYESSAIDIKATGVLLLATHEAILRYNLERSDII